MDKQISDIGERPNDKDTLWRYTSLAKLLNMISSEGSRLNLVACRMDKFEDDYEGTLSKKALDQIKKRARAETEASFNIPKGMHPFYTEEINRDRQIAAKKSANNRAEKANQFINQMRKVTYANCWRNSRFEDSSTWKAYTSSSDGVVIKSSFENVKKSLENWEGNLHLGNVDYVDFSDEPMDLGPISPCFYKQQQFETESEFRLVLTDLDPKNFEQIDQNQEPKSWENKTNRKIKTNADQLIDEIRVHPNSSDYLQSVVQQSLQERGLNVPVEHSSLQASLS